MKSQIIYWIPSYIKEFIKWVLYSFIKPDLPYLELHLTDHCNLNCKGCGHFSPIASSRNADIRQYELDMRRLSQLFRNIRTIRLMGGEPLLHPNPYVFITMTKSIFPESNIHFVTNGILLSKAPQAFWDACRETNTIIDMTVYPPLRNHVAQLQSICNSRNVSLNLSEINKFHTHMNLKGDSNKQKAFILCRRRYFCPFLQDGQLYICAVPALIHFIKDRFGCRIESETGFNIHSRSASGKRILQYLSRPIDTCRWCSYDFVAFPWSTCEGNPVLKDWVAE